MSIISLINELEDLMDEASSIPFSKKVSVDPEEVYDIISDLRSSLPEELKEAKWVNEERERILKDANNQAETLINQAKSEVEKSYSEANRKFQELVNKNTITKEAEKKSQEIIAEAEKTSQLITKNSLAYVDGMLEKTQVELNKLMKEIDKNRQQLK